MERYSIINFKVILLYGLQQSVPDAGKDLCRDILTGPLFFFRMSLWHSLVASCFFFFGSCVFLLFFWLLCSSVFLAF